MFKYLPTLAVMLVLSTTAFAKEKYAIWVEKQGGLITLSEQAQAEALSIQKETEVQLAELDKKWMQAQKKAAEKSQQFPFFKSRIDAKLKEGHNKYLKKQAELKAKANQKINKIIQKHS